ncbi:MAG: hypothetical protein KDB03_14440, partial [Planctomycetales bacterium]|nr:hypothetical protein [Planctomycetales bacterium]
MNNELALLVFFGGASRCIDLTASQVLQLLKRRMTRSCGVFASGHMALTLPFRAMRGDMGESSDSEGRVILLQTPSNVLKCGVVSVRQKNPNSVRQKSGQHMALTLPFRAMRGGMGES